MSCSRGCERTWCCAASKAVSNGSRCIAICCYRSIQGSATLRHLSATSRSWWISATADSALVHELLCRFPKAARAALPLRDYVHLRLAEGMAASAAEETEEAIRHFDFIPSLGDEVVGDKQLLALAHFWKGRCQRKQGEYDSALQHTVKGRELALDLGYPKMAAVMQVLEAWLYFQNERLAEAVGILQDAEAVLRETDDSVTLGNIHSQYGRIALREGRYDQALQHFGNAIDWFRKRDGIGIWRVRWPTWPTPNA